MENENKLKTISKLFEESEIRSIWNSEENYYFSVVDVISALTNSNYDKSRNYWKWLKNKLKEEGSQLVSITNQLKLQSFKDGKYYLTDTLNTKGILRLIESVPSPKAEPFKLWLASLGSERIDEVFDPEIAITRAINYYKNRGYTKEWIEKRLKGIINRNELTDVWKERGITENFEYAMLTNEIYKSWSSMKANEYKSFKGLRKENLRDNMTELEVMLTDIGETNTKFLAKEKQPIGLKENLKIAALGGSIANDTRKSLEEKLNRKIITHENNLNYKYEDTEKLDK